MHDKKLILKSSEDVSTEKLIISYDCIVVQEDSEHSVLHLTIKVNGLIYKWRLNPIKDIAIEYKKMNDFLSNSEVITIDEFLERDYIDINDTKYAGQRLS